MLTGSICFVDVCRAGTCELRRLSHGIQACLHSRIDSCEECFSTSWIPEGFSSFFGSKCSPFTIASGVIVREDSERGAFVNGGVALEGVGLSWNMLGLGVLYSLFSCCLVIMSIGIEKGSLRLLVDD